MPVASDVKNYIDSLPDDRKKAVGEIRKVINKNLPKGFQEGIGYGMILWSVPHSLFPAGYHCDPSKPLMIMSLGSTKGHISLHHMGLYGSGPLMTWFKAEWPKRATKKLDMGKACIRFKRLEDVPIDLIGELASKLTPQQWIETYEKNLAKRSAS
jgi:hypothetical protein